MHENCGVTACFKNYVGTAPRALYCTPGRFWNVNLHAEHAVDTRIDPFIADLSAFHPPDYNVVDVIRGLQFTEHNNNQPDQMLRNNIVMAGEDTVAMDAAVSRLLGFNPNDIDYLHMQAARGLGTFDLSKVEIVGDELDRLSRPWAKPRSWHARANREWALTRDPASARSSWKRYSSFGESLYFEKALDGPSPVFGAAAKVISDGNKKGFLWLGLTGKATVTLNGQKVMEEENITRYRVGQFQQPIELKPGENQIVLEVRTVDQKPPQVAVVLCSPANNGDSIEGVRWTA